MSQRALGRDVAPVWKAFGKRSLKEHSLNKQRCRRKLPKNCSLDLLSLLKRKLIRCVDRKMKNLNSTSSKHCALRDLKPKTLAQQPPTSLKKCSKWPQIKIKDANKDSSKCPNLLKTTTNNSKCNRCK